MFDFVRQVSLMNAIKSGTNNKIVNNGTSFQYLKTRFSSGSYNIAIYLGVSTVVPYYATAMLPWNLVNLLVLGEFYFDKIADIFNTYHNQ